MRLFINLSIKTEVWFLFKLKGGRIMDIINLHELSYRDFEIYFIILDIITNKYTIFS